MRRIKMLSDITQPIASMLLVATAASLFASCSSAMTEPTEPSKLDPILQERLDTKDGTLDSSPPNDDSQADSAEPAQIEVLVALAEPPTAEDLDALTERGLTVRSAIGEILTGVVAIDAVEHLAEYDAIVKIESSTPLGPEDGSADSGIEEAAEFNVNDITE